MNETVEKFLMYRLECQEIKLRRELQKIQEEKRKMKAEKLKEKVGTCSFYQRGNCLTWIYYTDVISNCLTGSCVQRDNDEWRICSMVRPDEVDEQEIGKEIFEAAWYYASKQILKGLNNDKL
jgi:hypothetical protein